MFPAVNLRLFFLVSNLVQIYKNKVSGFIQVFHDKEIWRISVRLSDRSEVTQHKKNFVKNCPQWDLNPWPPDHQSNALLTVLERNLLKISEVSFLLFHAPLHMLGLLFISKINKTWLYKGLNDSYRQPNSDLAQLTEQWTDDLEVVNSKPHWGQFLTKFILFCVTLDLSDKSDRNVYHPEGGSSDSDICRRYPGFLTLVLQWESMRIFFPLLDGGCC